MSSRGKKIIRAWLESPVRGILELSHDWKARYLPPVHLSRGVKWTKLEPVPGQLHALESGFFMPSDNRVQFVLPLDKHPEVDPYRTTVYLCGTFNGWKGFKIKSWAMAPAMIDGREVLVWTGPASRILHEGEVQFKFITSEDRWLSVPHDAPNVVRDSTGNLNRRIDLDRTGRHLFRFHLPAAVDLSNPLSVHWQDGHDGHEVALMPGDYFFNLYSDLPLGALVRGGETVFRLFAPRAGSVVLVITKDLESGLSHRYALKRRGDGHGESGVWEVTLSENLHGWFYWYHVDGPKDMYGLFDPAQKILDPYAEASVGREGPGIVLDPAWVGRGDSHFATPAWQDLVIVEAHVRDMAAYAPLELSDEERRGFTGLRKWVESEDFYLHRLGVNCVELQPVQEFDNVTTEEYHWGYMTNNYFSPESSYSLEPQKASGVHELQELVRAFHRRGMAVVLDVVFNHVGVPGHLMFVDKLYYFEQDGEGNLSNWSGCGNDLRTRSAMARRLVVDSCLHLVRTYGVDGFRFDLADLVGKETLVAVEQALKRVKPDIILIAEPWSFRGHIAGELRDTGWASWNDGYRNFLREYVMGGGSHETLEYFLKGSPWHYAKWPAQTINYVESHDDSTWIDLITEHGGDGHVPTFNDRRRTHLMAAVLFSSIGIPMISSGQDFLRSKRGVNNTYLRGDLNALDYLRLHRFPGTHAYFAAWIRFRLSKTGRLFRHFSRASEGFFRFFWVENTNAAAVVYNADYSQGPERLLLALNPSAHDVFVDIGELPKGKWRQVADHEHFLEKGEIGQRVSDHHFIPALGCGLWVDSGL